VLIGEFENTVAQALTGAIAPETAATLGLFAN
jgi:hypothetical protein